MLIERRADVSKAAAALFGFSVLVSVGLADGGVFPRAWRLATVALVALAAAAMLTRTRVVFARLDWAVVASFGALAGWMALSATWSGRPTESILQAERAVVYVAAVLAVLLMLERDSVPYFLAGVVAGITAVSAYGLVEYLFWTPPLDPFEGRLLHRPFGYANALGIFAAIGILVGLGLSLQARGRATRTAALLPLVVLAPTLYFTSSRGAWLALAFGLAALVGLGVRSRLTLAAAAVVAVLAVLLASGAPDSLSGLAGDNRADYWRVAWEDYRDHPVLGAGAGTYGYYWLSHGVGSSFTRTAHSLYLQSLAELGPIGLLLVSSALGLPLARLRRRGGSVAAAAAAGSVAYVLHTGVDWDWEMPAATLAGVFCLGALLVATRPEPTRELRLWQRIALLLPLVGLAVIALLRLASGPSTPFGP